MGLFNLGQFALHSGGTSRFKIECDALTETDIYALAEIAKDIVGAFGSTVGIPTGGLRLAEAMAPFATEGNNTPLICDDVLTTGASMWKAYGSYGGEAKGLVIFARSAFVPEWVTTIFAMHKGIRK